MDVSICCNSLISMLRVECNHADAASDCSQLLQMARGSQQQNGASGTAGTAAAAGGSRSGSALAHFISGPPPLRPSGKAQKAGEEIALSLTRL
jgi:hypothetical protein